jgi:hypothetical protein
MNTRGIRKVVAAVLAGGLMAVVSPAIAHAQSPQNSDPTPLTSSSMHSVAAQSWYLQNQKSQKYLQPLGASSEVGALIVQQPFADARYQAWWLIPDDEYMSFQNNFSSLNLGIDQASTTPGAPAIQATPDSSHNQDWLLQWRSDTVFELHNRKSHLCLGISGASTADGAQAAQFPCDGSLNQGWSGYPVAGQSS